MPSKKEILLSNYVYDTYHGTEGILMHLKCMDAFGQWIRPIDVIILDYDKVYFALPNLAVTSKIVIDRVIDGIFTLYINELESSTEVFKTENSIFLLKNYERKEHTFTTYHLYKPLSGYYLEKIRVPFFYQGKPGERTAENMISMSIIYNILTKYGQVYDTPLYMRDISTVEDNALFIPKDTGEAVKIRDIYATHINEEYDKNQIDNIHCMSILNTNVMMQLETIPSNFQEIRKRLTIVLYYDGNEKMREIETRVLNGKKVRI